MEIKLSNRLAAVAGLVLPGKAAADIGTDHAYLAVYLIVNGVCPVVVATDRVRGPLASASQLVDLLSLNKQISVRLGEGLTIIEPGEVQTVCIAGMGGYTIRDILVNSPAVVAGVERLVLQPQSNISVLRRYLCENGWKLVEEDIVYDSGFYYEVLAVEKGRMELSEIELEFGPLLMSKSHPLLRPYLSLKKMDLVSLITELQLSNSKGEGIEKRLEELMQTSERIDNILNILPEESEDGDE